MSPYGCGIGNLRWWWRKKKQEKSLWHFVSMANGTVSNLFSWWTRDPAATNNNKKKKKSAWSPYLIGFSGVIPVDASRSLSHWPVASTRDSTLASDVAFYFPNGNSKTKQHLFFFSSFFFVPSKFFFLLFKFALHTVKREGNNSTQKIYIYLFDLTFTERRARRCKNTADFPGRNSIFFSSSTSSYSK